jgi:thioesterase domain-containing protein
MSLRTHYIPGKIYQGPVQLVLVDDKKLDREANLMEQERVVKGWKRWAPNLVSACAPGNHMTVLKPPHVHSLARLILGVINDVDGNEANRLNGRMKELLTAGSE